MLSEPVPWPAIQRLVAKSVAGWWQGGKDWVLADRAAAHLVRAGNGNVAWPPTQSAVMVLRDAGRFREALERVNRVLAAKPKGHNLGLALTFSVHLNRRLG